MRESQKQVENNVQVLSSIWPRIKKRSDVPPAIWGPSKTKNMQLPIIIILSTQGDFSFHKTNIF